VTPDEGTSSAVSTPSPGLHCQSSSRFVQTAL